MSLRLTWHIFTVVVLLVVLGCAFVFQWGWGLLLLGPLLFPETVAAGAEIITIITKIMIQVLCAMLLYLPFCIRNFWGGVVERFYPTETVKQLRTLLVRNSGLFYVNLLLTLIMVLLYIYSFSYAQINEEIAMAGMVLSMAGIGILLIPFIWPIAWFVAFFVLTDHVYQTFVGTVMRFQPRLQSRKVEGDTDLAVAVSASNSRSWVSAVRLPPVSWSLLLGCAVAVIALLNITSVVSQGLTSDAISIIVLTVVIIGVYLTALRTFSHHGVVKALLLTVLYSALWFFGSAFFIGIMLSILGIELPN